MDLYLIKGFDSRYEEYEQLLLERDQVHKEASQIWTAYVREFGQLITDSYEEKVECIKRKKTIAFNQAALNHGGVVDQQAMEEYLDREMASYYAELFRMQEEKDRCSNAGISTLYEVKRSKELYRRLAKLIHPDINPATDREEKLRELEKIEGLKKEIDEVRHTDPYIYKDLLENDEAVKKKKSELEEELKTWQKYRAELDEVIAELITNGGIKL